MEFVFDDCLMESIDVTSLEERNIDEVIRENAHTMLDCEMDMEDILNESNIELLTEGALGSIGRKMKSLWEKFRNLVHSIIKWFKSLFKKDKDNYAKADFEITKMEDPKPREIRTMGGEEPNKEEDYKRIGAEPKRLTAKEPRPFKLIDGEKVATACEKCLNAFIEAAFTNEGGSKYTESLLENAKNNLATAVPEYKAVLANIWVTGRLEDVVGISGGEKYTHTICHDADKAFKSIASFIVRYEETSTMDISDKITPSNTEDDIKRFYHIQNLNIAALNGLVSATARLVAEDREVRMRVIREFNNINPE